MGLFDGGLGSVFGGGIQNVAANTTVSQTPGVAAQAPMTAAAQNVQQNPNSFAGWITENQPLIEQANAAYMSQQPQNGEKHNGTSLKTDRITKLAGLVASFWTGGTSGVAMNLVGQAAQKKMSGG